MSKKEPVVVEDGALARVDTEGLVPETSLDLEPRKILLRQLLGRLIIGQTIGVSILAAMTLGAGLLTSNSSLLAVTPMGAIGLLVGLASFWLLRRQHELPAAYVFLLGTVVAITPLVYLRGFQDASALYYLWPILAAALLLEVRGTVTVTAICTAVYATLVALQWSGYQVPPFPYDPQGEALLTVGSRLVMFFLLSFLGWQASRNLGRAVLQAGEAMRRWRGLSSTLEQRIAERTRDLERRARYLEATALVAHDTAAITDPDKLVDRVVELISDQFGFYHTGLFLLDEGQGGSAGEWAVLKAASSEGGRRMLVRGHRLRIGREGIVGYAVRSGHPRIALDVGEDAVYFDNPELPETRSEMALPLRVGGEIIGALDVQSRERAAFSDEDVAVLQTLADQVAVALHSARLFQELQGSLEAERRAYGELSGAAWAALLRSRSGRGFTRTRAGIAPAGELSRPEMERAIEVQETILGEDEMAEPGDAGVATLAIPIEIGGRIIGVVDVRRASGRGEWAPAEVQLAEVLSGQLGLALEGARLYQDTQRRATQERLVGEVTGRLRETLDVDTMLRVAAQEIRQALGLSRLAVRLTEPDGTNEG